MLSIADIQAVAAKVAEQGVDEFGTQLVREAAQAADEWIADNQFNFNLALPLEFRNGATLEQKTLVFAFVALRRAGLV
jgi:hypothetical protein